MNDGLLSNVLEVLACVHHQIFQCIPQSYSSVLNTLRISFSLLVGFGDLGAGEQPLILHTDVPFK